MPSFNPYFPQNYFPQLQQQPQQQNSFIHVQAETQAREWPVSLGSSVTFINDNEPYCYTKSMGMSQFEPPVFKKFKLVEVSDSVQNEQEGACQSKSIDLSEYVTKAEFNALFEIVEKIRKDLYNESIDTAKTT